MRTISEIIANPKPLIHPPPPPPPPTLPRVEKLIPLSRAHAEIGVEVLRHFPRLSHYRESHGGRTAIHFADLDRVLEEIRRLKFDSPLVGNAD